jgi:hypothetical protein
MCSWTHLHRADNPTWHQEPDYNPDVATHLAAAYATIQRAPDRIAGFREAGYQVIAFGDLPMCRQQRMNVCYLLGMAHAADSNSPPHASGLQPQSSGGCPVAFALAFLSLAWSSCSNGRFVLGRSPGDRVNRPSPCRQNGSAGRPPSRQADPLWLVSAPPRTPSPAGREHPLGASPSGVSEIGI